MKAILIDDEKPALLHLSRLIRSDGRIEVAGTYLSAQEGLNHLAKEKTDIVFLDIGMPEMNGLEAAEFIQQIDSTIQIVYITAFADYAIEAFELHALDYLLKPVDAIRFAKTLDRISLHVPINREQTKKKQIDVLMIRCFKRLELAESTGSTGKFKWRTLKSQELFAYLLHHKGEWVPKQQLLEVIWSDYSPDKALAHLHTSIYQTRKLLKDLGEDNSVEFRLDNYRLLGEGLITDAELFERGLGEIKEINERYWQQYDQLLSLYRGDYLVEHDYTWSTKRSNQLEKRFLEAALAMANYELSTSRERQALARLLVLQEKDPYSEEICRLILTAYSRLTEFSELKLYYESFVNIIRSELGVDPEQRTKELYLEFLNS